MKKLTLSRQLLWAVILIAAGCMVVTLLSVQAVERTDTVDLDKLKAGTQNALSDITEPEYKDKLLQTPEESNIRSLRLAIEDLITTFGSRYPRGEAYLKELDKQLKLYHNATNNQTRARAIYALFAIRHEALLANPLICDRPVLFVVRHQYARDHHNTHTMFPNGQYEFNGPGGAGPSADNQFAPGGALKMLDLKKGGKITTLIDLPAGVIRDPDVHWDGNKIIFSMRKNRADSYHIYQINADGTELKQLTFLKDADDMDPLYLPDNSIAFSSTREPKFIPCNRHAGVNIYHMDPDGANIHQITKNTLYDRPSGIMPDGRILYDRWEYVDRDSHNAQSLWTVNPDGTNQSLYWGNNTETPDGVIDAHIIPGTQQAIAIFASLHDRPRGILAIIDRRLGMDGPGPVMRTWPADGINLVRGPVNNDNADVIMDNHVTPVYEDPYPLNNKYFLVTRTTKHDAVGCPPGESIYLLDIFGNEILLHKEDPGCFDPMPVISRKRPLIRPTLRNYENKAGLLYVQNVYEGLKDVPRGTVKFLRVVEAPEKRYWASGSLAWFNYTTTYPGISWHSFETKRILGTVPVEEDGSVYFEVPSDRFVYFQLLDNQGMMIQSMRSGTAVQSGEVTGCVGCHDNRVGVPANRQILKAMLKPPKKLNGWYGEPREFNYITEVQPVFDKHCVKCHDFGKEAGAKLNLARDRNLIFNTSYNELWRKKYIIVTGAGPSKIPSPFAWGSHASPLMHTLQKGHHNIELSKEEFERIATWIDLNAIFYGSFASAYPMNRGGHSPLSTVEEDRLGKLTGINIAEQYSHYGNKGPLISFDRPEVSPVLSGFKPGDDKYKEALEIIEKGKVRLIENPDSDMPGFKLSGIDLWREEKYQYRRWIELRNRDAIRKGRKIYDTDQPTRDEWLKERQTFPCSFPAAEPDYLSPLAVVADREGKLAYIAMNTANRIAIIDILTGKIIRDIIIPEEPTGLALSPVQPLLYVTGGGASGMVYVVNLKTAKVIDKIGVGHSPSCPVISPDGQTLYVPNRFDNDVSVINLAKLAVTLRIPVRREPVAATLTPDGKLLFVANLLPDGPSDSDYVAASVSVISTTGSKEIKTLHLPNGSSALRDITISPDGKYVYVTHLIGRYMMPTTQLERGWMNTNAITVINAESQEIINSVLLDDLDMGAANPWGVAVSKDGTLLVVAHSGTHEISIIDRMALHKKLDKIALGEKVSEVSNNPGEVPNDLSFLVGLRQRVPLKGKGPRGVAIAGKKILVTEYFSDGLAIIDPGKQPNMRSLTLGNVKKMNAVRRGDLLFHDATCCFQLWQSCSSCHPDGRADGLNWELMNIGPGRPRNTKSLLYSHQTPPVMSHGIRANAEIAVRSGFKYIEFMPIQENDASAVDEYLKSMRPIPGPYLVDGKLSNRALLGKAIFNRAGCINCHSGQYYTNCKQYDLGTLRGWEKDLKQPVDVPSLIEVWRTAPYLHDGRALTVKEAFRTCNPKGTEGLSEEEIKNLTEYVLSL